MQQICPSVDVGEERFDLYEILVMSSSKILFVHYQLFLCLCIFLETYLETPFTSRS